LIGARRFGKATAITKQPGAEIDDVFVVCRRRKGPSGALACFGATAAIKQFPFTIDNQLAILVLSS
jgi:hypothetical protein